MSGNYCCWRDSKAAVRKQTRHSIPFKKTCLQVCAQSLDFSAWRAAALSTVSRQPGQLTGFH